MLNPDVDLTAMYRAKIADRSKGHQAGATLGALNKAVEGIVADHSPGCDDDTCQTCVWLIYAMSWIAAFEIEQGPEMVARARFTE